MNESKKDNNEWFKKNYFISGTNIDPHSGSIPTIQGHKILYCVFPKCPDIINNPLWILKSFQGRANKTNFPAFFGKINFN